MKGSLGLYRFTFSILGLYNSGSYVLGYSNRDSHFAIFAYETLVGKPEGKRPLGRSRRRWEDNIKMYLREIEWKGLDWIHLAQDRYQWRISVDMVMNLRDA
jgi:hypothetical protein